MPARNFKGLFALPARLLRESGTKLYGFNMNPQRRFSMMDHAYRQKEIQIPFKQDTKLLFRPLESAFIPECVEITANAFVQKTYPIASHFDFYSGAFQFYAKYFLERSMEDDTTVVCVESETGRVVGLSCAHDYSQAPERWFKSMITARYDKSFLQLWSLYHQSSLPLLKHEKSVVGDDLPHDDDLGVGELPKGRFWHIKFLAVHQMASNLGIGKALLDQSLAQAEDRRFQTVVAQIANDRSKKPFDDLEFETFSELQYKNFQFPLHSELYPLRSKVKPGNEKMYFMVKNLDGTDFLW